MYTWLFLSSAWAKGILFSPNSLVFATSVLESAVSVSCLAVHAGEERYFSGSN